MAVLFGHAIHALREEYSESTITIKEAGELQEQIEYLTSELAQVRQQLHRKTTESERSVTERFHRMQASSEHQRANLQGQSTESEQRVTDIIRSSCEYLYTQLTEQVQARL